MNEVLRSFMAQQWENARKHGAKYPDRDCALCAGVGFVCEEASGELSEYSYQVRSCDCIWPRAN